MNDGVIDHENMTMIIQPHESDIIVFDNMFIYLPVLSSKAGRFMNMNILVADECIDYGYSDPRWVLSIDGFLEYTEYH